MIEAFDVFDKDHDGRINYDELRSVMSQLGQKLSPEEIHHMISEADTDGDGKISYLEFATMMVSLYLSLQVDFIVLILDYYSLEKSKTIQPVK